MIETSMGWGDLRVLGGEADSHLKKLFKKVLRQKILRMCVCMYLYMYIHVHMYMCVCMVVTEVRKIAQRSLAHICMCLYILFALYPILICSNIKHCQGDVT